MSGLSASPRHLLIIGGQRCGTSYLYERLDEHPEIVMARPARPEPKVFCSDESSARGRRWYVETWFSHAGEAGEAKLLGDKSTSYLECPGAPRRAQQMLGDPLVLVQLRDPVDRAVSNWRFSRDHGTEPRTLEQALTESLDGIEPSWDRDRFSVSPYAYLQRGRFSDYLEPWLERFGAGVRVQLFEEQTAGGAGFAELYEWLGVDRSFQPHGADVQVNPSSGQAPELGAGLNRRLRGYFSDSDVALEKMLGREVPWRGGERR